MAKLSSEYYHLVPQRGYAYEKIKPIENTRILREQQGILHNLLEYEMIAKILAGAQYRIKGTFTMLQKLVLVYDVYAKWQQMHVMK